MGQTEPGQIERSIIEFEGESAISVVASDEWAFEELWACLPDNVVRTTTAGKVRNAGGDVVLRRGRNACDAVLIGLRCNSNTDILNIFVQNTEGENVNFTEKVESPYARVYADFNNADSMGRVRLNTAGTQEDILRERITLFDGLRIQLYDDELVAVGTVRLNPREGWVAEIDWSKM